MKELLQKYREIITYTIFGAGTVAVDVGIYGLTVELLGIKLANAMGWCGAVLFAFFTNKYFVFRTGHSGSRAFLREFVEFIAARLLSLAVEVVGVDALVKRGLNQPILGVTGGLAKVVITVVVILMNYLLSKFIIFRTRRAAS